MFKVQCPQCAAPYQVDERRVPPTGVNMRCPKCGQSFVVTQPGEPAVPVKPRTGVTHSDVSRLRTGDSATMLGVAAPVQGKPVVGPPKPSAPTPAAAGGPAPPPPRARDSALKKTMVGGVAGPPPAAARADLPSVSSASRGAIPRPNADQDLPDAASGARAELPSLRAPRPKPAAASPAAPGAPPAANPPRVGAPPAVGAPKAPAPLPGKVPAPTPMTKLAATPLVSKPVVQPTRRSMSDVQFDDSIELSSVPPGALDSDLPMSRQSLPAISQDALTLDSDLPASLGGSDSDLPASLGGSDSDLPASLGGGDASLPATLGGLDSILPAAAPRAPSSPAINLKTPAAAPAAARSSNLSAAAKVPAGALVTQRGISPPPEGLELPLPREPEPEPGGAKVIALDDIELGSVRPSSPAQSSTSTPAFSIDDSIELPSPAADFDKELAGAFEANEPNDFGFDPFDAPVPPAPGVSSPAPRAAAPSMSFPDLPDLDSGPAAMSARPKSSREAGDVDDERFALESVPPSQQGQFAAAHNAGLSSDGVKSAARPPTSLKQAPKSRANDDDLGGMGYGELDLGGDDSLAEVDPSPLRERAAAGSDDDAEFGAIPQEASEPRDGSMSLADDGGPPPAGAPAAQTAKVTREVAPERAEKAPQGKPSKRKWVVAGVLGVATLGGSLALLPNIGPFGAYAISDLLHDSQYQALLNQTRMQLLELQREDSFSEVRRAVDLVDAARAQAPRYQPLNTLAAYADYAMVVRFGGQPELQARAKVLLDAVTATGPESGTPFLKEAQLAEALLRDDFEAAARAQSGSDPSALEVQVLGAELALKRRDLAGAKAAWTAAAASQPSPWTQFGLVRTLLALGELDLADQGAATVLTQNPKHLGAMLVRLDVARQKGSEKTALQWGEKVTALLPEASPSELVQLHALLGQVHLQKGRLSKAETEFNLALQGDARNFGALLGLAQTHLKAGRVAAALGGFEAAGSASGATADATFGIVQCQLLLERVERARATLAPLLAASPAAPKVVYWRGRIDEAAGNKEAAEQAYRQVFEKGGKDPIVVDAVVALAETRGAAGKFDEAAELLRQAQARFADSIVLMNEMGQVALSQGRYDAALEQFQAARKLDPTDVSSQFNTGSALRRLRRFDEAWATLQEVAKLDPELPGLALERGLLLEQSGRAAEALVAYEEALKKAPKDLDLMQRVGCGRVGASDGKQAEQILNEVLTKRPRSSEALHCLGRALFLQNRNLEALKRLQQAVDIDPNRAEYHMMLGWVANEAGQVATAKAALTTALELDQGLADAYWQRGALNLRQGGPADAIVDFKKALELSPSRVEAYADLAQAESQLGRTKEALQHWSLAVASNGENPTWLFRYGKLLSAQHQNNEAAQRLEKALQLAEKETPPPAWAWEAHRLAAISLGEGERALMHWRRFLELSPPDSPYRTDAKRALQRAGQ